MSAPDVEAVVVGLREALAIADQPDEALVVGVDGPLAEEVVVGIEDDHQALVNPRLALWLPGRGVPVRQSGVPKGQRFIVVLYDLNIFKFLG